MKKQLLLLAALLLAAAGLWAQNCDDPCSGTMTIHHPPGYTFPSGVYPSTSDQSLTMTFKVVRTNLTGADQCWMAQNLGSTAQATSATDASDAAAGWYWQFNRKQAYKITGSTRTPGTGWITSINENSDWILANDPCRLLLGGSWRMPTRTEWINADSNGEWTSYNDTFSSGLRLHAAGSMNVSQINGRGSSGNYWSSTQYNNYSYAHYLYIISNNSSMNTYDKRYGRSVRCLSDL